MWELRERATPDAPRAAHSAVRAGRELLQTHREQHTALWGLRESYSRRTDSSTQRCESWERATSDAPRAAHRAVRAERELLQTHREQHTAMWELRESYLRCTESSTQGCEGWERATPDALTAVHSDVRAERELPQTHRQQHTYLWELGESYSRRTESSTQRCESWARATPDAPRAAHRIVRADESYSRRTENSTQRCEGWERATPDAPRAAHRVVRAGRELLQTHREQHTALWGLRESYSRRTDSSTQRCESWERATSDAPRAAHRAVRAERELLQTHWQQYTAMWELRESYLRRTESSTQGCEGWERATPDALTAAHRAVGGH